MNTAAHKGIGCIVTSFAFIVLNWLMTRCLWCVHAVIFDCFVGCSSLEEFQDEFEDISKEDQVWYFMYIVNGNAIFFG